MPCRVGLVERDGVGGGVDDEDAGLACGGDDGGDARGELLDAVGGAGGGVGVPEVAEDDGGFGGLP